jgi:hypothetical protein
MRAKLLHIKQSRPLSADPGRAQIILFGVARQRPAWAGAGAHSGYACVLASVFSLSTVTVVTAKLGADVVSASRYALMGLQQARFSALGMRLEAT